MTFRHDIRRATLSAHERLDNFVEAGGFLDDVAGYQRFMAAQAIAHRGFETWLGSVQPAVSTAFGDLAPLPSPRRSVLAQADAALPDTFFDRVERAGPSARFDGSTAALAGGLYVVEGSTLGSRLIYRALAEKNVPTSGRDRFLRSAGTSGAMRWRQFVAALDAWDTTADDRSRAIDTAHLTFDWFLEVFQSNLDVA